MESLLTRSLYLIYAIFMVCKPGILGNNYEDGYLSDFLNIDNILNENIKSNFLNDKLPKVDVLREDVDEDFELENIMALSNTSVEHSIDAFSSFDKMLIIDIHNIYRSNLTKPFPKGSNLMYVVWNDTLAKSAKSWLKQCQMKHGIGRNDSFNKQRMGQNIHQGPFMHPSRPLYLWYQEYKNYFFHNFSCKEPYPKYQCEHMTQMLWFDSAHVGCAQRSYCFPQEPRKKLFNCHYYRPGNVVVPGIQIYKYGWPCTRCGLADGNMCYHGLCVDKKMCKELKLDCECKLDCKNCVKPNPKMCRCEPCKPGWDGPDCSHPCYNAYDKDRGKQGLCRWKINTNTIKVCEEKEFLSACREECGACKPSSLKGQDLCCGGKVCPSHYVLDKSCNCVVDCPSNLCLYPPSSTTESPAVLTGSPNATKESGTVKGEPKRKEVKVPPKSSSRRNVSILSNFIFLLFSIFIFST